MIILNTTMDLIDAIFNRELQPRSYSGRHMYGKSCVACSIERGGDMEGLPKAGARVDQLGRGYIVYWPEVEWTPGVQEYVDTVLDPSASCDYWIGAESSHKM